MTTLVITIRGRRRLFMTFHESNNCETRKVLGKPRLTRCEFTTADAPKCHPFHTYIARDVNELFLNFMQLCFLPEIYFIFPFKFIVFICIFILVACNFMCFNMNFYLTSILTPTLPYLPKGLCVHIYLFNQSVSQKENLIQWKLRIDENSVNWMYIA